MSSISGKNVDSEFDLPVCKSVRAGYSMTGWTNAVETAFDDGQKNVKGLAFWNAAVKFQAVWQVDGYTVTFDNQGADSGKGGISSMKVEYEKLPGNIVGQTPNGKLPKVTTVPVYKSGEIERAVFGQRQPHVLVQAIGR